MKRGFAIVGGLLLIAVAFVAASRVADTREGLIAEIVTLLSGVAGVGLLLYGLVPQRRVHVVRTPARPADAVIRPRTANDLAVGAAGLLLALILVGGLVLSAGWQWALIGAILLLPMIIGCGYLVTAFVRAPQREWKIDVRRLTSLR